MKYMASLEAMLIPGINEGFVNLVCGSQKLISENCTLFSIVLKCRKSRDNLKGTEPNHWVKYK